MNYKNKASEEKEMRGFKTFLNEAAEHGWTPIQHAMAIAHDKHARQIRKFSGEKYSMHPKRVRNTVMKFTKNQDIIIAASLHDTVEDTKTSFDEISAVFGTRVANLVKELTSSNKEMNVVGKADYLLQKMMKMSPDALLIKLADRLDNVSDFPQASKKFVDKYTEETRYILNNLKRSLSAEHKAIIKQIWVKVTN